MKKRTIPEWLALFELQARSDLSQARFCKEQGLCPKYFSLRKRQLAQAPASGFIQLQRDVSDVASLAGVELRVHVGEVTVRVLCASVEQAVSLIKSLA